ncbi:hypothetical protein BPMI_03994c [Candidatus Burkholderia pumila]|uniref:Uncharacterized protein n=1 Tax=Candidatus Burkholderia pumila TaxID=1090375 RepID=A0ABR5HNT2_9BURK|nr:hypothetical protein BPMI_03994c [Candidatus Burkholderia pumila]
MSLNHYVTPIKLILVTLVLFFCIICALETPSHTNCRSGIAARLVDRLGLAQRGHIKTVEPTFAHDTTIVLLGGGTDKDDTEITPKKDSMVRIAATAMLYRQCCETGAPTAA